MASIKPIHSLVASVMQGVSTPTLLMDGANSPHNYSLKPQDAKVLQEATVIFWVGHELETFLEKPLEALASNTKTVALMDTPGVTRLAAREGDGFDHSDHAHDTHHKDDPHIWLDPENAKAVVAAVSTVLSQADPANAMVYKTNAAKVATDLDELAHEITALIAPAKGKGFIVFHDAYQYFETRFDVPSSGVIAIQPETPPGAKAITEIRARIMAGKIICVFAEPQFDSRLVNVILEGTATRTATLDPLGANLAAGPALYETLMKQLATSLAACLNP